MSDVPRDIAFRIAYEQIEGWTCRVNGGGVSVYQETLSRIIERALESERAAREAAETQLADLRTMLEVPSAVHINMLRGTIARPDIRSMLHVYGAEALAKWDRAEQSEARLKLAVEALSCIANYDRSVGNETGVEALGHCRNAARSALAQLRAETPAPPKEEAQT